MSDHGFRVTKNGMVVAERVVNDVTTRGLDPLAHWSVVGRVLFQWLNSETNKGTYRFEP